MIDFRSLLFFLLVQGLTLNPTLALKGPNDIFQDFITGTVTSEIGEPLPGVTVIVKGTSVGSVTDFDGQYNIKVPHGNATLVFSYIGFASQEVAIANRKEINVELKEDVSQLEEVVVVGYGTQKKENLTGSVSTITAKSIEDRPVTSLATALQGTAPGLNVTRTSGQPGSENIGIQIRGVTSANGSVDPLLLVDGVASPLFTMQTINPTDIETVTVLKDAAAAAIYGARAAGGVILITTKNGKPGKTTFDYTSQFSVQWGLNIPKRLSLLEEAEFSNLARMNRGIGAEYSEFDLDNIRNGVEYVVSPSDSSKYIYYNQQSIKDQVLRKRSAIKTHNLSIRGGTEKINYLFSLGYLDQEGVFKVGPDNFKRHNIRLNLGTTLTNHLSLDSKISYSVHQRDMPSRGANGYGLLQEVYQARQRFPIFTPEGKLNGGAGSSGNNTYAYLAEGGYETRDINDIDGTFTLTAKNFIKGLQFRTVYGRKFRNQDNENFSRKVELWGRYEPVYFLNNPNSFTLNQALLETENFQFLADYDLEIGEKHNFHLLAGYQWEDYRYSNVYSNASSLVSNDLPTLNLGDNNSKRNSQTIHTYANQSYFGRLNYSFDNKYLIEATIRADESSRLAPGLRIKVFPSASVGWNVHKEEWFSNTLKFISEFKPRISWGQLGNSNADIIGYYDYLNLLSTGSNLVLGESESRSTYFYQGVVPSSNLSWETVETSNFGFDLGVFQNKFQASFDYYIKHNRNMLAPMQLPATFGVDTPRVNSGVLKSWGWELAINYRDRIGDNFNYGVGFNISDNQNKLIEFEGRNVIRLGNNSLIEGFPINTIWGYETESGYIESQSTLDNAPFYSNQTGIGDVMYIDRNGDGLINEGRGTVEDHGDLVNLGTNQQRYLFGINANAEWKNLDFSIFFQGVGKRSFMPLRDALMPLAQSWFQPMQHHKDYWTPENPNAAFPRPYLNGFHNYATSDKWVLNGAYLRLKNIQLGYSLPEDHLKKIKLSKLRVFLSAQDILTFSKLGVFENVYDPEQNNNVRADYPLFGAVSLGLNLVF